MYSYLTGIMKSQIQAFRDSYLEFIFRRYTCRWVLCRAPATDKQTGRLAWLLSGNSLDGVYRIRKLTGRNGKFGPP